MLDKERLGEIFETVEKLLERHAPWSEVVKEGVEASGRLRAEMKPNCPYKILSRKERESGLDLR